MRDLIERWRARASKQRELDQHNAASVIDQMVRDLELTLERLAEGLAEPTGDGWYWVEGDDNPREIERHPLGRWVRVDSVVCAPLNGRRVWPVIDPRKGGA